MLPPDGCPSTAETVRPLLECAEESGSPIALRTEWIETREDADRTRLLGSPSVRDCDVFGFVGRTYGASATPPKEMIRSALESASERQAGGGRATLRKVYTATDPADAHLLKGLLEGENIAAEVRGEHLYGMRGHVPITPDTCPSVWVVDDADFGRATERVAEVRGGRPVGDAGTWRCRCQEENERQFTECWRCGRSRPLP